MMVPCPGIGSMEAGASPLGEGSGFFVCRLFHDLLFHTENAAETDCQNTCLALSYFQYGKLRTASGQII